MLAEPKLTQFLNLLKDASPEDLAWIKGYLAGLTAPAATGAAPAGGVHKVTIAYGTETGNSKRLAADFAARAKKTGIHARVVNLEQYRLTDLPKEEYFLTIISTQGEGEPPESAKKFYDHLHNNGFKLDKLKYSVLALGDTSYPLFCKAGEDIDEQFQRLGGSRIAEIRRCDVEYDDDASQWINTILDKLSTAAAEPVTAGVAAPAAEKKSTGKKSYTGTVISNVDLNDRGSNKATYHIEIAADDVEYEPGDAFGIVPENPAPAVEKILSLSGGTLPDRVITYKNESYTIGDLLRYKLNISHLITPVIKRYADLTGKTITATKYDLPDLLQAHPVKDTEQFVSMLGILNPIAPRLYTMSSSPAAHGGEVHTIVAKDSFTVEGRTKLGLCSNFLGALPEGTTVNFFVQKNKRFRLPAPERDIIMIGPGTGIAPFRSFLAERDATDAKGRNWLFFGEQHFASDFLYQTELQTWFETGVLTKISLAFSRDQPEKIYVQHRMWEHADELYQWIAGGAHVYLCGKKDPMSTDVEETLLKIIETKGEKTPEAAVDYFQQMKNEGKFSEDVY